MTLLYIIAAVFYLAGIASGLLLGNFFNLAALARHGARWFAQEACMDLRELATWRKRNDPWGK